MFKIVLEPFLSEIDRVRLYLPQGYQVMDTDTPFLQIGRDGFNGAVAKAFVDSESFPVFQPLPGDEGEKFAELMRHLYPFNYVDFDNEEVDTGEPSSSYVCQDEECEPPQKPSSEGGLQILPSWPL